MNALHRRHRFDFGRVRLEIKIPDARRNPKLLLQAFDDLGGGFAKSDVELPLFENPFEPVNRVREITIHDAPSSSKRAGFRQRRPHPSTATRTARSRYYSRGSP